MSILDDAREGMNPDIRPQDDLFGHVNGRWLDEAEIPADKSSWGAFAMVKPGYMQKQWHALAPMIESGVIKPPIGATYDLADFGRALVDMDERRTLGKSVVHLR